MSAFRRSATLASVALAIAAGLAGCGKQEGAAPPPRKTPYTAPRHSILPIDVVRVDLGTQANPDGTISAPTANFKPGDTIIAAVTTQRPAHDIKLTVRWLYGEDRVAKESSTMISPSDILVTDFSASNGEGWPLGQYRIEVLVNGEKAAVTAFGVVR